MDGNCYRLIFSCLTLSLSANVAAEPRSSVESFPAHPVKIIVAAASGSSPDAVSRQLGQVLGTLWKQPVVIENAVGLGGVIGTERAAKQPADGYTLLISTVGAMSVTGSLTDLPYDPVKDLEPVTLLMSMPNVLVVHPDVPAQTLSELIEYGKNNPTKLRYGHPGIGTTPHLSAELLKDSTGMTMQAIPYKSSAQMATDLLAGHYEVLFHNSSVMLPYIQSGKARALAVTSANRVTTMPDLPSVSETPGLKEFEVNAWWGVYLPAGVPPDLSKKIQTDVSAALKQASIANWVKEQGGIAGGGTKEELQNHQAEETTRWKTLIRKANIRAE